MDRRTFLGGIASLGVAGSSLGLRAADRRATQLSASVLVVGGGVGGVAAALAACRAGQKVVLTEETLWIGGQLTSQAVPPDEHPWIEEAGCTRSYRRFRDEVRSRFVQDFPVTAATRASSRLNPGGGWVSRLCHEPRLALTVLESMLAPFIAQGRLTLLLGHRPIAASVRGDRIEAVQFESTAGGRRRTVVASWVLEASELGDLLPLAGVEHVTGAESRSETGEPSAPEKADPLDQQAITWCFGLEHHAGQNHVLGRPDDYARWRDYLPRMTPPWPGRLFAWEHSHPVTLKSRTLPFDPVGEGGFPNLWTYRRIRDASRFEDPKAFPSVCLVNWPQNDHWLAPLVGPGVTPEQRRQREAESKALSRSLIHFCRPRPRDPTAAPVGRGSSPAREPSERPTGSRWPPTSERAGASVRGSR